MDELSYYCTMASLVLLHISFYWLYKQERRSRDTAWSPKYDRLKVSGDRAKVVLLVADEQHLELGELARERLEAAKFVVYELRLSSKLQEIEMISPPSLARPGEKKGESSQRRRTIWLNQELDSHLDSAIGLVESELSKGRLDLYGFVSFVFAGSGPQKGRHEISSNYLLLHLAPPLKLLVAFSSLIDSSKSRGRTALLVAPKAYRRQATKTNDNNKSQDYTSLFRTFECHIGEQLACGEGGWKLSLFVAEDALEQENQARPRWLSRAIGKIMRPVGSSPVGEGGGGGGDGSCELEAATIVDLVVNKIRDNGR